MRLRSTPLPAFERRSERCAGATDAERGAARYGQGGRKTAAEGGGTPARFCCLRAPGV
jgi:hypothetical protein